MTENLHSGQYFLMNDGCGPVGFENLQGFSFHSRPDIEIPARWLRLLRWNSQSSDGAALFE